MNFNEYLLSLDDDIIELYIQKRNLVDFPNIERFYKLEILYCYDNKFTKLSTLPKTLKILNCSNNKLTELPILPDTLIILNCSNNQLTNLPTLPIKLENFACSNNQLLILPREDIQLRLKEMPIDTLFECYSAFNGFGLYRTKKFRNIKYDGTYHSIKTLITDDERRSTLDFFKTIVSDIELDESKIEQCEHIYYNMSAIKNNNARIRIAKDCIF